MANTDNRRAHIYVIELDNEVLNSKKFREKNPDYITGKPCVYVGMTHTDPTTRFQQHLSGYRSSRYARKHGIRLRPRLFAHHNPMTSDDAQAMEVEVARRLRKRGYAVWQN